MEARGATWRDVLDLAIGCSGEWYRGEWNQPFVGRLVLTVVILAVALAVDLTSLFVVRVWQQTITWTPPASMITWSRAVPFLCLIAMVVSLAWGRRVQFFIAWTLVGVVFLGAVLDRFAANPLGTLYPLQVLWLGTLLSWDEIARSPYTSTSALGLRDLKAPPNALVFPQPPARPLGLDDAGDQP
jgi:hypothetical protein